MWSSYPRAIKNIQDGCHKTGQISDADMAFSLNVKTMTSHLIT